MASQATTSRLLEGHRDPQEAAAHHLHRALLGGRVPDLVAASGSCGVEAVYADENVWLSQKMMAQLYDIEIPTINYHLKKVFEDSELEALCLNLECLLALRHPVRS